MRLKSYDQFNEEINLRKAVIGGVIGASTLLPTNTHAKKTHATNFNKDTLSEDVRTKVELIVDFVDTIEKENPRIFINLPLTSHTKLVPEQYRDLAYLNTRLDKYVQQRRVEIDLDLITTQPKLFPFKINYFFVRGLDNLEDANLIDVLRVDYTDAIKISGHEVMFNFTRVQDVNTFGFRVNL